MHHRPASLPSARYDQMTAWNLGGCTDLTQHRAKEIHDAMLLDLTDWKDKKEGPFSQTESPIRPDAIELDLFERGDGGWGMDKYHIRRAMVQ